jgi:hypothetical protein
MAVDGTERIATCTMFEVAVMLSKLSTGVYAMIGIVAHSSPATIPLQVVIPCGIKSVSIRMQDIVFEDCQ